MFQLCSAERAFRQPHVSHPASCTIRSSLTCDMDQVSHAIVSSTSNVENGPTTIKTTMAPTSDNVPANTPTTAVPEQRETYPRTTSPLSFNQEEHPRGSVYQPLPPLPSAQTKRSTAGEVRILPNHNLNRPEVDWIVPVEKVRTGFCILSKRLTGIIAENTDSGGTLAADVGYRRGGEGKVHEESSNDGVCVEYSDRCVATDSYCAKHWLDLA